MMDDDENDDRRKELCERFRQSLTKPVAERFFDEDELVDLFDFAGDLADDYLKMEVLMCGARLYPESELLKERRAIYYSFISDEATSKYLEDNAHETSPIWEIMRIRARAPKGQDAERALDYLLGGIDRFEDEELIQFIELASQLGGYKWLYAHEEEIRKKSDYAPMFLYEMAVASEQSHDYGRAVSYLEELTEAEPMNAYYWYMLAQDYELAGKPERASEALEYSLAVDPECKEALQMRARILAADEATQPQALEIIHKLSEKYPDDPDLQRVAAFFNYAAGNVATSQEIIRHCLDRFPGDRGVLSDAVATGVGNVAEILDRFYAISDEIEEDIWLDWAEDLRDDGYYDEALEVLEAFERNSLSGFTDKSVYIDVLFLKQRFRKICEIVDVDKELALFHDSYRYANGVVCIVAMLKCGREPDACRLIKEYLDNDSEPANTTIDILARISGRAIITQIGEILRKHKNSDWSTFDPFGLWRGNEEGELPF